MEQLELFPLSEWTIREFRFIPLVSRFDNLRWEVGPSHMGELLGFNDGRRKWVYKLSHVEE